MLPTVPFGVQTTQLDIPFCLNMNPSTQALVLRDLVHALEGQGVRRLVVLERARRERLQADDPRAAADDARAALHGELVLVRRPEAATSTTSGDHAGELETSVMQHVAPDLVLPLAEAGPGRERKPKIAGLRERWAWTPRRWTQVSADTGIGDPKAATPEKGERFFRAVTERIGGFLVDLAAADPDDLYA